MIDLEACLVAQDEARQAGGDFPTCADVESWEPSPSDLGPIGPDGGSGSHWGWYLIVRHGDGNAAFAYRNPNESGDGSGLGVGNGIDRDGWGELGGGAGRGLK